MADLARASNCGFAVLLAALFVGCDRQPVTLETIHAAFGREYCDLTPEGSVWLTVVRLTWAEEQFHKLHRRYGALPELTNMMDGLPADVTAGRMGSYTIQ